MKRYILILVSILVCWSASAQKPTKEEKKAQRMERRAEREREQHIKDSLYWAKIFEKQDASIEKRRREGSTDIVATIPIGVESALKHVAKELINADYIINVDKEFGTITTQPMSAGGVNYTLYFRFSEDEEGCVVKACAFGHGNVGIAMYGIVKTSEKTVKIESGGIEGSVSQIAFDAMKKAVEKLPGVKITYISK